MVPVHSFRRQLHMDTRRKENNIEFLRLIPIFGDLKISRCFFSFRHTKHTQISLIFAIAKITRQCSLKNNRLLSQVYSFTGQLCSDELVVVFVESQTGGANRENTECPLMEKLRNINTHSISSLHYNICINWPL